MKNSNSITEIIMVQTTCLLFASWTYKHHINKKEEQRQTTSFQHKHNTKHIYGKFTNNKQQTHTLYVIADKQTQTQTSYQPKGKCEKQKLFNRNTTQDRHTAKPNNEQTNTLYVITYKHKKMARPKIQTIKTYEQVTEQNETQTVLQKE